MTARATRKPKPSSLYEEDFAAWIEQQTAALRSGRTDLLDIPNLLDELESLSRSDQRALAAQLRRAMLHLLKLRYQPERRTRSWDDTLRHAREEIADILEDSPSLRRLLPALVAKHYPRAAADAASETGLPDERFPEDPPFALEEILGTGGARRARRSERR